MEHWKYKHDYKNLQMGQMSASNNLQRVYMHLNKYTKPNQTTYTLFLTPSQQELQSSFIKPCWQGDKEPVITRSQKLSNDEPA